jgi:hypothetical protein
VFAEESGRIRAWPSGSPRAVAVSDCVREGVNNPPRPRTCANARGTSAARYAAWLLRSCALACVRSRLRGPACTIACGHLPQHFIRYQRLACDQVARARQVFQPQAQRFVQRDWRARRIDGAGIDAHHARGVVQSRVHRTSRVALKQFHRYFVQNEVLQRDERVVRPDPRRRHDSCLWSD